jgi:hypothetical protein
MPVKSPAARLAGLLIASSLIAVSADRAAAQSRYPFRPVALPDPQEIALAMTAAPAEISSRASIYTVRGGRPVRIREGTNGCACMVARDLHEGSLYPICFDAEGARTRLWRELMELTLRVSGSSEEQVKEKVDAAYRDGTLRMPSTMSVTYMMSPRQVLFSSPFGDGRRVGAWWPHLMIMGPGLSAKNMGLADSSVVTTFTVGPVAAGHSVELVVKLPSWSDGTPVKP